MKFLKKIVFIPILGLVLAGCNPGTTTVAAAVANERVAKAMGQTTMSSTVNTMSMSIGAELDLVQELYQNDAKVSSTSIEASGNLDLKATDLSGDNLEASLTASASLVLQETEGGQTSELFNETIGANVYLNDMWLYFHLTGIGDLMEMEEDELKAKVNVEGVFENIEVPVPTSTPNSEELTEMTDMMETMLMEIDDVEAVETNGNLVVTYTITVEDIVDVIVAATTYFESDMTASEIEAFRQEGLDAMNDMIKINTAKIVVGVSSLGYLNRFDVDVDVEITTDEFEIDETTTEYEVVKIDALIEFAMEINGNVTVTPLTGLDEYIDMNPQETY